jgi:hypothetical protein
MQTSTYIDLLLKKYRQAPSFPFDDWTTEPVSFYALMNLWDEIFRTAAGQLSEFYIAGGDAQMDIDSLIFHVGTRDKTRRVNVHPEPDGGVFFIFTKTATEGYAPDRLHLGELPDRSELGFATDLDRNRLIAAFEMIRTYTHTDLPTLDAAEALGKQFVETYKQHFGFPDFDPFAGPTPDDDVDEQTPPG